MSTQPPMSSNRRPPGWPPPAVRGGLLAWADENCGLHVFNIAGKNSHIVRVLYEQLAAPVGALAWCSEALLASGDLRGEVRLDLRRCQRLSGESRAELKDTAGERP